MRWAVLRSNLRTDERRVVRSYGDRHQAEAAATRMNKYHREHKRYHLVDRAMTLPEAEAMAERTASTRRARLELKRRRTKGELGKDKANVARMARDYR